VSDRHKDTTEARPRVGRLSDIANPEKLFAWLDSLTPEERRAWGLPPKKRGRPPDQYKQLIWAFGARLRTDNKARWSWPKLAKELDPNGYNQDRHKATDRMRQGIESVLARAKKSR